MNRAPTLHGAEPRRTHNLVGLCNTDAAAFVLRASQASHPVSLATRFGFAGLVSPQTRFAALVRQHQDRVFGLAMHLTGDRDVASDMAQEAFIRLWTHREQVEEARAGAWLLRVTRNLAIDHHRSVRRRACDAEAEPDDFADTEPLPDEHAERSAAAAEVHAALDGLREPFRSLLVLREMQELTYEEIAEVLDLPMTSVKVYLHRARKMLRAAYLERNRAVA